MNKSGQKVTLSAHLARRRKRRRLIVLAGIVIMAWAIVLGAFALRSTTNFFRTPSEITAEDRTGHVSLRLGGYVEKGTVVHDAGTQVRFKITDFRHSESVSFNGILPDLFREGQGIIAEGRFRNGAFIADRVLAKHDERYMPKDIADRLKEQGLWEDYPDSDH